MSDLKGRPRIMKSGARKRSIKISKDLDDKIAIELQSMGFETHSEFFRFIANVYFRKKSVNPKYWLAYLNEYTLRK